MNLEVEINYNITKGQVYSMAVLVQKALSKSVEALVGSDYALTHSILKDRAEIQAYETKVSDSSLMTLLLDKTPHILSVRCFRWKKSAMYLKASADRSCIWPLQR